MRWILAIFAVIALATGATRAENDGTEYDVSQQPSRLALVIGNGTYTNQQPLPGALTDADAVAKALGPLGFKVTTVRDVTNWTDFYNVAFQAFLDSITPDSLVLFYYSGHGFSYGGEGFLVPLKFNPPVPYLKVASTFLSVTAIRDMIAAREPAAAMMVLDACRSMANVIDPTGDPKNRFQSKALSPPLADPINTVIWFASSPNQPALADPEGHPSYYTDAFLAHLASPGMDTDKVRKLIRIDVLQSTGNRQVPWSNESSSAEIWLNPTQATFDTVLDIWRTTRKPGTRNLVEKFLIQYGSTPYAAAARKWLVDHQGGASVASSTISAIAPEALWDNQTLAALPAQSFGGNGSALQLDGPLGLPRTIGPIATARVGTAPILPPNPVSPDTAWATASALAQQGRLVTRETLTAQRTPADSSRVTVLPPGTPVEVWGRVLREPFGDWLSVNVPGVSESQVIRVPSAARLSVTQIGRPAREMWVPPPPTGPSAGADTAPIASVLQELRQGTQPVSWVSIATPPPGDGGSQAALLLRANFVAQFLVGKGVPADVITTAEGRAPRGDKIRLRFFTRESN